jgi:hydroxyacylglutathione hydrolase
MEIKQFFDENLAHMSYVVVSDGEAALIDPARDPQPYYDYVTSKNATIKAVFETHPHADFVSSHLEIHNDTGADIYVSKLLGAQYAYKPFDEGDSFRLGKVQLKALNTPGHSPDSLTIVLEDESGTEKAYFTGDTLFIGDVGRPDLREKAGNIQAKREELAGQMFESVQQKIRKFNPEGIVYPAHGAGSLCGKSLSTDMQSTIGKELQENPLLSVDNKQTFVKKLVEGQPYIPKYFVYDVALNRKGAPPFRESVDQVKRLPSGSKLPDDGLVVDIRSPEQYAEGHIPGSINIHMNKKFETWVGSIVDPEEPYYLVGTSEEELQEAIERLARIGYELFLKGTIAQPAGMTEKVLHFDPDILEKASDIQIVDVRTPSEAEEKIFPDSRNIPLHELRERVDEVEKNRPVVTHCAGGGRGATALSILQHKGLKEVFNMGEYVKKVKS